MREGMAGANRCQRAAAIVGRWLDSYTERIAVRFDEGVVDQARAAHARGEQHVARLSQGHHRLERLRVHNLRVIERDIRLARRPPAAARRSAAPRRVRRLRLRRRTASSER